MRSVLISIQPRWCEHIATGAKTIELRKTRPTCEPPFKCFIYETKDKAYEGLSYCYASGKCFEHAVGKVIGEFTCDDIDEVAVFNDILYCVKNSQADKLKQMRLNIHQVKEYLGSKNLGYTWHISNLVIYDKPRDLSEFYMHRKGAGTSTVIAKPPQSWCYAEASEG